VKNVQDNSKNTSLLSASSEDVGSETQKDAVWHFFLTPMPAANLPGGSSATWATSSGPPQAFASWWCDPRRTSFVGTAPRVFSVLVSAPRASSLRAHGGEVRFAGSLVSSKAWMVRAMDEMPPQEGDGGDDFDSGCLPTMSICYEEHKVPENLDNRSVVTCSARLPMPQQPRSRLACALPYSCSPVQPPASTGASATYAISADCPAIGHDAAARESASQAPCFRKHESAKGRRENQPRGLREHFASETTTPSELRARQP
jgi:hypothetical protein